MRLINHVSWMKVLHTAIIRINQFVENKEQAIRINRPRIKIIIAIFAVVEVKAAKLSKLHQPGNDHFDIGIWGVMAKINQTLRFWTKR